MNCLMVSNRKLNRCLRAGPPHACEPAPPLPRHIPKRKECASPPKDTHYKNMSVKTPKLNTTQMSGDFRMDTYIVAYLCKKREQVTATHNNIDDLHRHSAEQITLDTKEHI